MTTSEEETTVITIRGDDPLCVATERLTTNSSVFNYLLDECKFTEHDMSDFNPDAVFIFLTLLDDKTLGQIEPSLFREINKLACVFEVSWLQRDCRKWIISKISSTKDEQEIYFLFEECYFVLKRLQRADFMESFVQQFARSDEVKLISEFLCKFEELDTEMIRPLVELGGCNSEIFLQTISKSVNYNHRLSKNAKTMLQNINLTMCIKTRKESWTELFEDISHLPHITIEDLRITQRMLAEAVRSLKPQQWKEKTSSLVYSENNLAQLKRDCKNLDDLISAVGWCRVTSMCVVIEILLHIFTTTSPQKEDIDKFIVSLERLCEEKHLQRAPWQFIDLITPALKYSTRDEVDIMISLLDSIRDNPLLSSPNRQNIVLKKENTRKVTKTPLKEYNIFYKFRHPATETCQLPGVCGFVLQERFTEAKYEVTLKLKRKAHHYASTHVHYHEEVSARDMCVYSVTTQTMADGTKLEVGALGGGWWKEWWDGTTDYSWWWRQWLPDFKEKRFRGYNVIYNVSEYMVAK